MGSTMGVAARPAKPGRRRLKLAAGGVAALVVGWFAYATVNILSPSQGDLERRVDAVASLAPQAHRLPMAQQLVANGVAETLAASYFDHDHTMVATGDSGALVPLAQFCEHEHVLCFSPAEATVGEARALAEMARRESWDSLTVVTNQHHVFRTRFIFNRCLGDDVDVNVVYAHRDYGLRGTARRVLYENAAFFKAVYDVASRR